jgi:HAD superfamily hydrolase (TIGR01509 family)
VLACQALLFDMDGLMVDSEPMWFDLQSEFVRDRGGVWTRELALRCVGGGLPNALRVIREVFGFAVDLTADTAWMMEAFVARVDRMALKPGCAEIIGAAHDRGIPRAVASSSTRHLVQTVLRHFDLLPYFDAVVTGECVARAKPAPDIFLEAARQLAVQPRGCVVLEDSLAGVHAARAAGMQVIAIPEHPAPAFAENATAVVADLHAARALLAV